MTKLYMNLKTQMTIEREYETDPMNPRDWENIGTFYTWEDRYYSPDKHNYSDPLDFFSELLSEEIVEKVHNKYNNTTDFMKDIQERLDKVGYILYPVSKYEHGDIIYNLGTASSWDSGTVGIIFAEKKKIYVELGCKVINNKIRDKVVSAFKAELDDYTAYANGYVFGYIVQSLDKEYDDSCWGFYDELELEELVSEFNLGDIKDWQEYDENILRENFYITTKIIVTPRNLVKE